MLRSSHLKAVAHSLVELGTDCSDVLKAHQLPSDIPDFASATVPFINSVKFFEDMALEMSAPDLGLQVGHMHGFFDVGPLGTAMRREFTVFNAINTLIANAKCHNSAMVYNLYSSDAGYILRSESFSKSAERYNCTEQYTLMIMISVVRMGVGNSDWAPKRIWMRADGNSSTAESYCREFPGAKCHFSEIGTAISIDHEAISAQMEPRGRSSQPKVSVPPPIDTGSLAVLLPPLIESYLWDGYLPIETAAEITGLSKRTMQRQLQKEGVDYSTLVNRTRMELALNLISRDPEINITHLSQHLGYTHPNSFARTFRRWTGVSPTKYKQLASLRMH